MPITTDTPTSSGVCTPRYMREKATSTIMTAQTILSQVFFVQAKIPPKVANTFCVWPLGKEKPPASATADSTGSKLGSSTHGRGMRKRILRNWLMTVPRKPSESMK